MHKESANTMINESFEIFHVKDIVEEETTLYHYHSFYEIHCTLNGSALFFIDGREFQISAGTILLIPPNTLHRIIHQTSDFFERTYLFINQSYLAKLSTSQTDLTSCFRNFGRINSRILKIDPAILQQHLAPLRDQIETGYGKDLIYQSRLINFMIFINQLAFQEDDPLFLADSLNKNEDILAVITYIDDHLTDDLSLTTVAASLYMSPYTLSRIFKQQTGVSFHSYVLKKRLLMSKEVLRKTRNASQTYLLCGFNSYTHFLRCFKNEFHLTPKEFLKEESQNQYIRFDHYERNEKPH